MSGWTVPIERLAATRAGAWFYTHLAIKIDRVLMPLTRGRVRMSLVMPSGLLICRGAKSGAERTVPLVYVPLGDDRVLLIASNGGNAKHPAWYHNLRAHPDVRFVTRGTEHAYRSRQVEGAERDELWQRAVHQYLGYDTYQTRTARRIGVFVLDPA